MAYTEKFKKEVIRYLKLNSITDTAKKFNISPDTIRYWTNPLHRDKIIKKEKEKYNNLCVVRKKVPYSTEKRAYFREYQQKIKLYKTIPSISYTEDQCKYEIRKLESSLGNYLSIPNNNRCVLTFQQHFYEKERELWQNRDVQDRIISNRCKYLNKTLKELTPGEILRGFKISGEHYGFSHFSSLWFKAFINEFSIKSVYDPCGGWGHRALGVLGTDTTYYYNDFDQRTCEGVRKIVNLANLNNKVVITNNKSEEYILPSNVDAIFTCPPYYNKEKYNNSSFKSYEDFEQWWNKTVQNCLKTKCKYFAIIIDNDNIKCIKNSLQSCHLIREQQMFKNHSHFNRDNIPKSYESLYIYEIIT
jgi:tRNA1(Val) A37 N6-methylase TrmN6